MLRIQTTTTPDTTTFALAGRLTAATVGVLEAEAGAIAAPSRLLLDLAGVAFVDLAGARCLHDWCARGARIRGASPFVSLQMRESSTMTPPANPEPSSPNTAADRVRRLLPPLLTLASTLFGATAANAAIQEAFAAVPGALADDERTAQASLRRALVRECLAHGGHGEAPSAPRFTPAGARAEPPPRWQPTPAFAGPDGQARLRQTIARLPARLRCVVALRDLEGLDTDTTADLMAATPAEVRRELHLARHALCDWLAQGGRDAAA